MQRFQRPGLSLVIVLCAAAGAAMAAVAALAADELPGKFTPTAQSKIVPADSTLEWLWNEGEFTEGPTLGVNAVILFSDIGNRIMRYDPNTGVTDVFRANSGRTNGLMFNQKGELIACEGATGGNRRISITSPPTGSTIVTPDDKPRKLADNWRGKKFNSPNDLAIDARGRVYFTDPRYDGDEPRDLDFEGVFLVDTDGSVTLATRDVQKPNGILVSIDGKTVYVADNNPQGNHHLVAFTPKPDGTLGDKRILFDFGPNARGIDGMTLDVQGNLYATAGTGKAAGVYVFGPAGQHLAFIPVPGDPTNCVFGGGNEAKTLYITAPGRVQADQPPGRYALYRIKLKIKGHHIYPPGQ